MKTKYVKQGTVQPIKPFQSIAEEAEFWDARDATEEITEGTNIEFHRANKTDTLTIRFSHSEQGIGPSTLARMFVKGGLQTR